MNLIDENRKWKCMHCGSITLEHDLLEAVSPFNPFSLLTGCPVCLYCEDFKMVCDEPGCNLEASCGWPTGDVHDQWGGYRTTCSYHRKKPPTPVGNLPD